MKNNKNKLGLCMDASLARHRVLINFWSSRSDIVLFDFVFEQTVDAFVYSICSLTDVEQNQKSE